MAVVCLRHLVPTYRNNCEYFFLIFIQWLEIGLLQVFTQPNLIKDHKSGTSTPPVGVLVAQLCPTLWDSMDCSPPGSTVHGIFQARILEWVGIPFSRGSSRSNLALPHYRQILYHLSHQRSPWPWREQTKDQAIMLTTGVEIIKYSRWLSQGWINEKLGNWF